MVSRLTVLYVRYFGLSVVSCGTGDADRRACSFVCIAHDPMRGPLAVLLHLIMR